MKVGMHGDDPKHATGSLDRQSVAAGIVAGAAIGVQILVPLIWPQLDRTTGLILLGACVIGFLVAVGVFLSGRSHGVGPRRRWQFAGIGQGWIEARVRNNCRDELMVAWNSGAENDRISVWVTFSKRTESRKTDAVELIFDIDGMTFEWDVPDHGEAQFMIEGIIWQTMEAIKLMLDSLRGGHRLTVAVPALNLRASFTLEGAFEVLEEVMAVGTQPAAPQSAL